MFERRIAEFGKAKIFGFTEGGAMSGTTEIPQGRVLLCWLVARDLYKVAWDDEKGDPVDECSVDANQLLAHTRLKSESETMHIQRLS